LNPKKLFPNSYQTLTVPVYNTTQSVNNSKTYYPIYGGGGVNGNLNSPQVTNQIGTQTPTGAPQIVTGIGSSEGSALGQGELVNSTGGVVQALSDGNILGAIQIAGTARNTFKNSNLKQIAKGEINGILTQSIAQALPGTVRSTTYYPGYSVTPAGIASAGSPTPNVLAFPKLIGTATAGKQTGQG
jgi:hypothetical protein